MGNATTNPFERDFVIRIEAAPPATKGVGTLEMDVSALEDANGVSVTMLLRLLLCGVCEVAMTAAPSGRIDEEIRTHLHHELDYAIDEGIVPT